MKTVHWSNADLKALTNGVVQENVSMRIIRRHSFIVNITVTGIELLSLPT